MNSARTHTIIQKLELISRNLARRWGKSDVWEDIYSDMYYAFLQKEHRLTDKPLSYIIKVCTNETINNYLSGKSICSKPRHGLTIISVERMSESIPAYERFEEHIHRKIFVEVLLTQLSKREKQVASLIMQGHTEKEISAKMQITQQRVNRIKQNIKKKAYMLKKRRGVI